MYVTFFFIYDSKLIEIFKIYSKPIFFKSMTYKMLIFLREFVREFWRIEKKKKNIKNDMKKCLKMVENEIYLLNYKQ